MKRLSAFSFLLFLTQVIIANTLTGTVTDKKSGEPLIGATILVKGTSTGTVTDFDGKYTLTVSQESGTIVVSYVGYDNVELPFSFSGSASQSINIQLEESGIMLNETVVTASRFERKLGEETVSIELIKPSFIGDQNLTSADDVLGKSPGVTMVDGQTNIRGGSGWAYGAGSRVLILQDDLPIVQADAGRASWSSIPLENVGQIEIIKGAASALYGSSAMNGIINIKTAFAKSDPETSISLFSTYYGDPKPQYDDEGNEQDVKWWKKDSIAFNGLSDTTYTTDHIAPHPFNAGLSFAHRRRMGADNKVDLVLGAFYINEQKWRYGDFQNGGRLNAHIRYRANQNMTFGIRLNGRYNQGGNFFLWRDLGADKYLPNNLTGNPTLSKVSGWSVDPYFEIFDDNGNRHKFVARYIDINNNNTNDQENFSDNIYAEYQYQRSFSDIALTVTGGMAGSYTNVRAPLYGDKTLTGYTLAAFAQVDKKFFDKLNVALGLRMETNKITETKRETKPVLRLGLNYQAAEATYIRASFGQAYRFPTIAEKFIQTEVGSEVAIVPNTDLISETGLSAEVGLKQGWKTSNNAFSGFIDVAFFYMRYKNMMEFNVDNDNSGEYLIVFQSKNVGNTFISGVETSVFARGKFRGNPTSLVLGYTFIDPKFQVFDLTTKNGGIAEYNVLKYRYRHTFSANWDIDLKGFTLGTSWQYFSFMENLDKVFADESGVLGIRVGDWRETRRKDGREANEEPRSYYGDFIIDFHAGWHSKGNLFAVSFHVKNVTNREYSLRPGLVEAPRNYGVRIDLAIK